MVLSRPSLETGTLDLRTGHLEHRFPAYDAVLIIVMSWSSACSGR
jgi:hypothetical protein